jgi:hypothetical protein
MRKYQGANPYAETFGTKISFKPRKSEPQGRISLSSENRSQTYSSTVLVPYKNAVLSALSGIIGYHALTNQMEEANACGRSPSSTQQKTAMGASTLKAVKV